MFDFTPELFHAPTDGTSQSTRISAAGPEPTCAPGDGTVLCPLDDENTSYTASDCTDFVIECDQDRIGGDLPDSPTYPGTFGTCVDSCAEDEACVAVVYDAGPCYLKSELGATAELLGATGARKASATVSAVLSTQASASETDFLSIQPIESTSTDEVPIFTISESAVETTTAVVTVTEPVVATVIETATVIVTVTRA